MPGVPNIINLGNGRLVKEEYYNNEDNLVKEKILRYQQHSPSKVNIKGVKLYSYYGSPNAGNEVMFYNVYSEWWHPESTIETIYDSTGSSPLTVKTDYEFQSPVHKQTTGITQQTSAGKTKVTNLYYPSDAPTGTSTSGATMTRMVSDNMLNPILKQETVLDGATTIEGLTTNFSIDQNNHVVVESIQKLQPGVNTYRTETEFSHYDLKGNFQEVTLNQNIPTAYLWDYNDQYPVAKVINATFSEIAYGSFETSEKGGWEYSGAPVIDGSSKTGDKVYHLGSGAITKSDYGGSTADPFTVVFWVRGSGSANWTVMGRPVAVTTDWQRVEFEVTGETVTIPGTSGIYVDELRMHPLDARMTTFTYKPLVGMTSSTDPAGLVTQYNYDSFGRLESIRDNDGHVVETYEYNYASDN